MSEFYMLTELERNMHTCSNSKNNVSSASNQHIRMIWEGSCDIMCVCVYVYIYI